MALQLGALRDALIEAGASEQRAREAAEEAAGYEDRLRGIKTRMTGLEARMTVIEGWLVSLASRLNLMMAVTLAILASQVALWMRLADLSAAIARLR